MDEDQGFTFQYGYFIVDFYNIIKEIESLFTFQYGYFIVPIVSKETINNDTIYIPIWLFYSKL